MQGKFLKCYALIVWSLFSFEVRSQFLHSSIYNCSLNKVDSFPDSYSLILCDDSTYSFYLEIGYGDHIGNERISDGKYSIKNDTLVLFDKFLKCDFKLLHHGKKLNPIIFFSTFKGSVFIFFDTLKSNQCYENKIVLSKNLKKDSAKRVNRIDKIIGCYIQNIKDEAIIKNGKYYANYCYKINISSNGTFEYWIYNNLVMKGKWSFENEELQLLDSFLNHYFTLYFNEKGLLIPLRFPGNYTDEPLFELNRYDSNVELLSIDTNVPTEIPDEP